MRKYEWHERLKEVLRNYETALRTVEVFRRLAASNPDLLFDNDLSLREIDDVLHQLGVLYFTRLYACFESALRHFWRCEVRNTRPSTEVLIDSIAARRGVSQDALDDVHDVREFRNYLIHEDYSPSRQFTIQEASKCLHMFISRLPETWSDTFKP